MTLNAHFHATASRLLSITSLFAVAPLVLVTSLTQSVSFPLRNKYSVENAASLNAAFKDIVDSSEFFVSSKGDGSSCRVPVFGEGVKVEFKGNGIMGKKNVKIGDEYECEGESPSSEFILSVDEASKTDFGWICAKFYESKGCFEDLLDTTKLRGVVTNHYNQQPCHPGYDAATAELAGSRKIQNLFSDESSIDILGELEEKGFVVFDKGPKTNPASHKGLSRYLVEKTGQGDEVRTDTVHFLSREEAKSCQLEEHYDLLMGVASYLNENLNFRNSPHAAIGPATDAKPLTIPKGIQLAEYRQNEFYKAHSDNSLTDEIYSESQVRIRSNFRHYTCILYCNDDWSDQDGGALRIYPGSRNVLRADDAKDSCNFQDVRPHNGRMILFDSCLVHSVEPVTHSDKLRRALTIWINRPEDNGVQGEKFF